MKADQKEASRQLNIASMVDQTHALGPGTRAAVWVQGCPLNCPGCIAPQWIPFVPAMKLTPEQILDRLSLDKIDGLTFSGGEPMEQAAGLAALIRLARQHKPLNLICFTGYRYERLLKNPPNPGVAELLDEIDVLIDGPYVEALNDAIGLRGSSNQRVISLTPRLSVYKLESQSRNVEVKIADGELVFVGVPTPGIMDALKNISLAGSERSV